MNQSVSEHKCHVLVDGSNMLHRVLHVPMLQSLKTEQGYYTGGVYGFLKALRTSVQQFGYLGSCVVVWDGGHSQRRKELYPSYKDRPKDTTPIIHEDGSEFHYLHEYLRQREMINSILPSLGVRTLTVPGREADDAIAFLARSLDSKVVIISEDCDFYQLVTECISVYRPIAEELITPLEIKSQFGFPAEKYVYYHAILGDGSDNIPGIDGVGPGTACKVLEKCDTLEDMFVFSEGHTNSRFRKIHLNFDNILRNLELVDLTREDFTQLELAFMAHCIKAPRTPTDLMNLARRAQEWEMKSIYDRVHSWAEPFTNLR